MPSILCWMIKGWGKGRGAFPRPFLLSLGAPNFERARKPWENGLLFALLTRGYVCRK
jgi:hypothetical protein